MARWTRLEVGTQTIGGTFGLTVARSTVTSRIGANRYAIDSSIESAGLASFFDDTKAKTSASGRIDKNGISPNVYTVKYTYGEKAKQTTLHFAKGNVVQIANSPPLPKPCPSSTNTG